MLLNELKRKAAELPLLPGVYLMKDSSGAIIYVGKAKKLKNRVSQYFQDNISHTQKTRLMVSHINDFDVIVAASEFEALILECSLIKQHLPKYNILLKDDKGFPYIRLDIRQPYPTLSMSTKVSDDAEYFGPFGSRGITNQIIETINTVFKLPTCGRKFPRDIGKDRPCLNHHLDKCTGWCRSNNLEGEYHTRIDQVRQLLLGNYQKTSNQIRIRMLEAAEQLQFELAAELKKRLDAVEHLGKKQLVTAVSSADMDVIAFSQTATKFCFTILHYSCGTLIDKHVTVMPSVEEGELAAASLTKQYYLNCGFAPKKILTSFKMEDGKLYEQLLSERYKKRIYLTQPQRGDNLKLVQLALQNANEEAVRATDKEDREKTLLHQLEKMLGVNSVGRIESFDISNLSGTDIVASMVVFEEGRPQKSAYRLFRITGLNQPDDYASMHQVIQRRFTHYLQKDDGFEVLPSILLIDGGVTHAVTALNALQALNIDIPVFGMVKDNRHRTRALVTPQGQQIRIDNQQNIFSFIGRIQEETHRFAISFNRKLRTKRISRSELDGISGIGPKRKQELLRHFKTISAIKNAALEDLKRYIPSDAATAVYQAFHKGEEVED